MLGGTGHGKSNGKFAMNAGDALAQIAETQIGTRGDLQSGRAALYGYLLATDVKMDAFQPEWARRGFGTDFASHYRLLNQGTSEPRYSANFGLREPGVPELPVIFRIHSWCAAFVDWCIAASSKITNDHIADLLTQTQNSLGVRKAVIAPF